MFDISKFDTRTLSNTGVAMPIPNPRSGAPMLDDEGKPVTITLLGPNSDKSKALLRTLNLRRAEMQSKGIKLTDEDFDRERFDFLCGVTVGWSFDTAAGQPFPFNPENVRKFWADTAHEWVSTYAWSYAQQDGNYLPS